MLASNQQDMIMVNIPKMSCWRISEDGKWLNNSCIKLEKKIKKTSFMSINANNNVYFSNLNKVQINNID